jgi:hypothetical protein
MKKITVLLCLAIALAFFASCGTDKNKASDETKKEVVNTPEDDAKLLLATFENLTNSFNEISADSIINDAEAVTLKTMEADFRVLQEKLTKKYEKDKSGADKMEAYVTTNGEEVYTKFMLAMDKLYLCQGADKLQLSN